MSRTVRRKDCSQNKSSPYYSNVHYWTYEEDEDHVKLHGGYNKWGCYGLAFAARKMIPLTGRAYDKAWHRYHGDALRSFAGGSGPSWWINEYFQKPHRREAKRQLQLAMKDDEYEVILPSKPRKGWWD